MADCIWLFAAGKMAIYIVAQLETKITNLGLNVSADAIQEDIEEQGCIHITLLEASRNLEPASRLASVRLHCTHCILMEVCDELQHLVGKSQALKQLPSKTPVNRIIGLLKSIKQVWMS